MNENMVNIIISELSLDVLKNQERLIQVMGSSLPFNEKMEEIKKTIREVVMSESMLHNFKTFVSEK
jgi:hypothetical protein